MTDHRGSRVRPDARLRRHRSQHRPCRRCRAGTSPRSSRAVSASATSSAATMSRCRVLAEIAHRRPQTAASACRQACHPRHRRGFFARAFRAANRSSRATDCACENTFLHRRQGAPGAWLRFASASRSAAGDAVDWFRAQATSNERDRRGILGQVGQGRKFSRRGPACAEISRARARLLHNFVRAADDVADHPSLTPEEARTGSAPRADGRRLGRTRRRTAPTRCAIMA